MEGEKPHGCPAAPPSPGPAQEVVLRRGQGEAGHRTQRLGKGFSSGETEARHRESSPAA